MDKTPIDPTLRAQPSNKPQKHLSEEARANWERNRPDHDIARKIHALGERRRQVADAELVLNDAVTSLTNDHNAALATVRAEIAALEAAIEAYCGEHRARLTEDGKRKSARFATGVVAWRGQPAKVEIAGAVETVIALIKAKRLTRFIRVKEEIDKEALLADPKAADKIAGVRIVNAAESFTIKPHEADLTDVAEAQS